MRAADGDRMTGWTVVVETLRRMSRSSRCIQSTELAESTKMPKAVPRLRLARSALRTSAAIPIAARMAHGIMSPIASLR